MRECTFGANPPSSSLGLKPQDVSRERLVSTPEAKFQSRSSCLKEAMLTRERLSRCGTTSPESATECIEYNCARTWGFVIDCKGLEQGVQAMLESR